MLPVFGGPQVRDFRTTAESGLGARKEGRRLRTCGFLSRRAGRLPKAVSHVLSTRTGWSRSINIWRRNTRFDDTTCGSIRPDGVCGADQPDVGAADGSAGRVLRSLPNRQDPVSADRAHDRHRDAGAVAGPAEPPRQGAGLRAPTAI